MCFIKLYRFFVNFVPSSFEIEYEECQIFKNFCQRFFRISCTMNNYVKYLKAVFYNCIFDFDFYTSQHRMRFCFWFYKLFSRKETTTTTKRNKIYCGYFLAFKLIIILNTNGFWFRLRLVINTAIRKWSTCSIILTIFYLYETE